MNTLTVYTNSSVLAVNGTDDIFNLSSYHQKESYKSKSSKSDYSYPTVSATSKSSKSDYSNPTVNATNSTDFYSSGDKASRIKGNETTLNNETNWTTLFLNATATSNSSNSSIINNDSSTEGTTTDPITVQEESNSESSSSANDSRNHGWVVIAGMLSTMYL